MWHYLLILFSVLTTVLANVACVSDSDCQTQSKQSTCLNKFCTNPFVSGCLSDLPSKRVCSSLDKDDLTNCSPNEFDFPEVRIYPGNWESSMFTTWVAQIYLSEVLRVPVTIETGSKDVNMDFYHPENTFGYPSTGYNWKALKFADTIDTDACPQSMLSTTKDVATATTGTTATTATAARRTTEPTTTNEYVPCAHSQLEVWPAGNTKNLNDVISQGWGEIAGSIGGYGKISWYTFERVIAADPSLKSFYGFTNRKKIANLFKRPISWYEYCIKFAIGTCDASDTVVKSSPVDAAAGAHYYIANIYPGYFKGDNCVTNPTTCTGYIVGAPCDWSTYVDAQIRWSHPNGTLPLVSEGTRDDGGYTYGQMQEIYEAAGRLNENVLMWWWEPETIMERWKLDKKWKLTSIELPDYSEECNDLRPITTEKCSADPFIRVGKKTGSGCANPIELLTKVFSNGLRKQLNAWTNSSRSSTAIQTPAHAFLQRLQVDTPFLNRVLYDWRWTGPDSYPTNLWARDVVCRHVRNISVALSQYNPPGYPKIVSDVLYPADFIALQIVCYLGIAACLLLIVFVHIRRNSPKIRASQPLFLQLILVGGVLIYISCILQLQNPTSRFICQFPYWTMSFGFGTFFVPLLLKTYRLYAVFDAARHMKRIKISTAYLMGVLCAWLFLVEGVLSLVMSIVLNFSPAFQYVENVNDPTKLHRHHVCRPVRSLFDRVGTPYGTANVLFGILCTLNLLLVLIGVVLAIRTRNISSKFSESSQLAAMMYNSLLFAGLAIVFVVLPEVDPIFQTRTNMVLMMIGLSFNLMILFIPKFMNLGEDNSFMSGSNSPKSKSSKKQQPRSKTFKKSKSAPDGSSTTSTTTTTPSSSVSSSTEGSALRHTNMNSHAAQNESNGSVEHSAVVEMTAIKEEPPTSK